jgi:hypothetical protein
LDLSVGECESDHSETTRMTRLREKRHSSFSQILMRGSILSTFHSGAAATTDRPVPFSTQKTTRFPRGEPGVFLATYDAV